MKLHIEMELGNEALRKSYPYAAPFLVNWHEVDRILKVLGNKLIVNHYKEVEGNLDSVMDINGNSVCRAYLEDS